jgi:hypothetical protein
MHACYLPPSLTFTAVTVSPALVLPIPVVRTERGINFAANFKNCDFPVPENTNKYINK